MTTTRDKIEELKRQIGVMQAYERGEVIEYRGNGCVDWKEMELGNFSHSARWNWSVYQFRIKPKKRVVWLKYVTCIEYVNGPKDCSRWVYACEGEPGAARFVEAD